MLADIHVHTFEIEVTKYSRIRVIESPKGADISECDVELDEVRRLTIDLLVKMLRENRLSSIDEYKVLGANLYSVLFNNPIGDAIYRAYYEDKTASYLLIKLTFDQQAFLSSLPWEYLYRPKREGMTGSGFLAEQSKLVLVRNLHLDIRPQPLLIPDGELPINILFVAPSPKDQEQVEYQRIMEELDALKDESGGRITVYPLVQPEHGEEPLVTFEKFKEWISSTDPHVIHFVGHGKYDFDEGGRVAFLGLDSNADWVKDSRFAGLLAESPRLRLVFLQACESGLPNPYQALSGVAMELAHRNIPAVVAMQYKIKQHVASEFAQVFYHSLTEKNTIEYAVQQGRHKIADKIEDSFAFGLPVLYMRQSGSLMTLPEAREVEAGEQKTGRVETQTAAAGTVAAGSMACPWCGVSNNPGAKFCRDCLKPLKCPHCGNPILLPGKGCDNCGRPLFEEPETRAPSQGEARSPAEAELGIPSEAKTR